MKIGALLVILFIICLIQCSELRRSKGKNRPRPPKITRLPKTTRPKTTRPPKVTHSVSPHSIRKDSRQNEINIVINDPRPYDPNVQTFPEAGEIKEESSKFQSTIDDNNESGEEEQSVDKEQSDDEEPERAKRNFDISFLLLKDNKRWQK
ncbi:uncharacterized protein LOC111614191 isoform X2 [Centruroides sculpturatus]|uniref:uncharacterized protein LOC111614191 isoform X2 n=1 Tax=Centruroides sculpturatus TaxID=218467 RepID=UPI000C6CFE94|nr:uncharacterized protein LOC111614191 isoform X2 [Centruroides sculpturatus]